MLNFSLKRIMSCSEYVSPFTGLDGRYFWGVVFEDAVWFVVFEEFWFVVLLNRYRFVVFEFFVLFNFFVRELVSKTEQLLCSPNREAKISELFR